MIYLEDTLKQKVKSWLAFIILLALTLIAAYAIL